MPPTLSSKEANAEDDVYYKAEMARIIAELVRPLPLASTTGEKEREQNLWAFLLRAIQTHLYIHACTPLYCLKNRASCRFFFPWPEQRLQQYDETTDRIALRRGHAPDDQYVVPHNLELAAFSPSTVNVMPFDSLRGADQARSYGCKYVGKPEPWYYLETQTAGGEANPVKKYLQSRNVGLCMAHNRLLGYRVVRSTIPTQYVFPQFTVALKACIPRAGEHLRVTAYPDPKFYMNDVQQYFFRHKNLRHLRTHQFFR